MNLNPLEQINNIVAANKTSQTPSADALRKAAQQFEAILLTKLTSALNSTNDDEEGEDSLFGSDAGTGLAKQMFSEQLATTMANSGGVGLADMLMQKFGVGQPKAVASGKLNPLAKTISTVKAIRENKTATNNLWEKQYKTPPKDLRDNNNLLPNNRFMPELTDTPVNQKVSSEDDSDLKVISTFEDQVARGDVDESVKNMTLNGKVLNTTRARVVPEFAIRNDENPAVTPVTTVTNPTAPSIDDSPGKVSFQMPVTGRISSGFGNRFHPIDKKIKFHTGLDIAVPKGTRVNAAAGGEVVFAGESGNYGNLVILRHPDGRETRYGHLEKVLVSVGERVSAGQEIAKSGSTGKSTGPHLHFEVRENGQVVNPLKILSNVLPKKTDR